MTYRDVRTCYNNINIYVATYARGEKISTVVRRWDSMYFFALARGHTRHQIIHSAVVSFLFLFLVLVGHHPTIGRQSFSRHSFIHSFSKAVSPMQFVTMMLPIARFLVPINACSML